MHVYIQVYIYLEYKIRQIANQKLAYENEDKISQSKKCKKIIQKPKAMGSNNNSS